MGSGGLTPMTPAPIFTGGKPPVTTTPPAYTQPTTAPASNIPSNIPKNYINPATGDFYTAKEIVANMAKNMPVSKGNGDIGKYAGDVLMNQARGMNNARNDISVGQTDPYDITQGGKVVFSPQERTAIEKAYAGVYDPALNDVFSRLKAAEEQKAADLTQKNELERMAQQHIYNMAEKGSNVSGPSSYQEWTLAGGKDGTGQTYAEYLKGGLANNSFQAEIATTGRQAVGNMLKIAQENTGIFGRTAALPLSDAVRSDAFRNYKAQLDTLKGNIIPAALTAMREASKTGGALGQVSDREGAWLGASLGALEMTQSPEQIVEQLKQIDAHLKLWEDAVKQYGGGAGGSSELSVTDPAGGVHTFATKEQADAFRKAITQ
jgi:hypothetical protein